VSGRVLVTGDRGLVGSAVVPALRDAGFDTSGFDARVGMDTRDAEAVTAAIDGCTAVVHLAARPSDDHSPEEVMAVNVLGTANVLLAAARERVDRVVLMSSAQALGVFAGHRRPDYLPLDDQHPTYAAWPYALSKRVCEELCARFSAETAIPTLCLRPPVVLDAATRALVEQHQRSPEHREGQPFWEYGAFIAAEDLAGAVRAGLQAQLPAHRRVLVCAEDLCAPEGETARGLARRLMPEVPWRGGPEYEREPFRSLVDGSAARELLDWMPRRRWRPDPFRGGATA
jgi:UDP-glucose 4-epimerase